MPKAAAGTFELPERLRVLRSFYTDAVVQGALQRLILGESIPAEFSRGERKAALLLVRELNPDEVLLQSEEAVLRGIGDEKLKGHKERSELPAVICGIVTPSKR